MSHEKGLKSRVFLVKERDRKVGERKSTEKSEPRNESPTLNERKKHSNFTHFVNVGSLFDKSNRGTEMKYSTIIFSNKEVKKKSLSFTNKTDVLEAKWCEKYSYLKFLSFCFNSMKFHFDFSQFPLM